MKHFPVSSSPQVSVEFPEKLQCLFKAKRYKILYGGRGAGRSWGVARSLLSIGQQKPIQVLCARELQNSIEESVHKTLSTQIPKLGLEAFYEIQKDKIIGSNGTVFSFVGIKNNPNKVRSYEGIDIVWVEEGNKVSKNSWGILLPTIRKKGSEIWITFNPELETDYTYTRFVKDNRNKTSTFYSPEGQELWLETDDTIICKMTYRDNPWFWTDTELAGDMAKDKVRDIDAYLNVWEGQTVQALEGAVYARELRKAAEEKRICTVPYEPEVGVSTYWDLGRADYTAIWFIQKVAMQYRVLDFYAANAMTIPMDDPSGGINHFLAQCQKRGFVYDTFWLPHDAKHRKLGMKHSIEQIIRNAGYKVEIAPKLTKVDSLNAVRMVLPNCYFDEDKCDDGLNGLRHYRYKIVDGQLSSEPIHDWASDYADAFATFATSRKTTKPRTVGSRLVRKVSEWAESAPGLGWMG